MKKGFLKFLILLFFMSGFQESQIKADAKSDAITAAEVTVFVLLVAFSGMITYFSKHPKDWKNFKKFILRTKQEVAKKVEMTPGVEKAFNKMATIAENQDPTTVVSEAISAASDATSLSQEVVADKMKRLDPTLGKIPEFEALHETTVFKDEEIQKHTKAIQKIDASPETIETLQKLAKDGPIVLKLQDSKTNVFSKFELSGASSEFSEFSELAKSHPELTQLTSSLSKPIRSVPIEGVGVMEVYRAPSSMIIK